MRVLSHLHRFEVDSLHHLLFTDGDIFRFCERILVLKEGRIVADGPTETVIQQSVLETVYEIPLTIFPHPEDGKPLVTFGRVGHGR